MLKLLLGPDWVSNSDHVLQLLARDVADRKGNRILLVPELISHDTEHRLARCAGDPCSRYAQVLSFTRLSRRVTELVGCNAPECLDNGGRVVAMAAAARQLHSRLKAYASVETRPEFLSGLLETVDEFKRCCITAADLRNASVQTEGAFAQKLEELSLLLEAYDSLCMRGKRDPRDQMTWLLEQLEDSDFAREQVFYIDGFPDFSRQHLAIVEHLIRTSPQVTVSLNCDTPGSNALAFERPGKTAAELIHFAKQNGIPLEIEYIPPRNVPLSPLHRTVFQGSILQMGHRLRVYRAQSVYSECVMAAEHILSLVHSGVRYRDIAIVCGDMAEYRNTLSMVFRRCGIPLYQSGTEEILDKPAVYTVLSAMEAALGGFEQEDVLRYMRSVLSPLLPEACDELENYVLLWSITGKRWSTQWDRHPKGLNAKWDPEDTLQLEKLNEYRRIAIEPLEKLCDGFRNAPDLARQVHALYEFLEQIQLSQRLENLAAELDAAEDKRTAQILNQLWEILLCALEQLHDVLGASVWEPEVFVRLLKLLLQQYDVGTIPPVLDAVTAGPVSAMRCQRCAHLLILGAQEGALPGYGGTGGVLTDQERNTLRQMGIPLAGTAMEAIQSEFSEIYGVFCGAAETVTVSCPGGQPSFIYRRLLDMAQVELQHSPLLGAALTDPVEAGAYLARWQAADAAERLQVTDAYQAISRKRDHALGSVSAENIRKLYGNRLQLSASQVDKQAECRLAYFLQYGISARERKAAEIDPAEFGTYVHAVLEQTVRTVMEMGGFHAVTAEQAVQIASEFSREYAVQAFSQLDSSRMDYLFRRNAQELELIVRELWRELNNSDFVPVDFELRFGMDGKMPPVAISGQTMDALLRGVVDRVDAWQADGCNYFRVVDYKTGKKDFDYCDVFNGIGLQMLLYLFALSDGDEGMLGSHPVSAGVQYFPARVPYISADGALTPEEAEKLREKAWTRRGLLLADEAVLQAMEHGESPKRLCCTRGKDGTYTGDLASREQLGMLRKYLFHLLGKMVDDIASGNVTPNPYTRGSSFNACTFCPYGDVCHNAYLEGRRDYKAMSAQQFWEWIEKELNGYG